MSVSFSERLEIARKIGARRRRQSPPPLHDELCRVFNARGAALMCALRHGQLTIDGYVIRPEHLNRWTPDQLRGRYAKLGGQQAQLYGSKVVGP